MGFSINIQFLILSIAFGRLSQGHPYVIIKTGSCEQKGYVPLSQEQECLLGAKALTNNHIDGFAKDNKSSNLFSDHPIGCSIRQNGLSNGLYFFSHGATDCGTSFFYCICKRVIARKIISSRENDCRWHGCTDVVTKSACEDAAEQSPYWIFGGVLTNRSASTSVGCYLNNYIVYWNSYGEATDSTAEWEQLCVCGSNPDSTGEFCLSKRVRFTILYSLSGALLSCFCFILVCRCRKRKEKVSYTALNLTDLRDELLSMNSSGILIMIDWDELQILNPIGRGSFGIVHKAIWNSSTKRTGPQEVAIKLLSKNHSAEQRKQLSRELWVATRISVHPNVISLFGQTEDPVTGQLGILMPFYELGSLEDHLYGYRKKNGSQIEFEVLDKLNLLMGLTRGLLHLHRNEIIHGDIATRNLLLHQCCQTSPMLVITDFGMSREWSGKPLETHKHIVKGPLKWMAPELLKGSVCTKASDVFSFAVTCYEILSESIPYEKLTPQQAARETLAGKRPHIKINDDCKRRRLTASSITRRSRDIQNALNRFITQYSDGLSGISEESFINSDPTHSTLMKSARALSLESSLGPKKSNYEATPRNSARVLPKRKSVFAKVKTLRNRQYTIVTEFNILSQIQDIVEKCWHVDPNRRPEFWKVHEDLSDIYLRCLSTSFYDMYDVFPSSKQSSEYPGQSFTLKEPTSRQLTARSYESFSFKVD